MIKAMGDALWVDCSLRVRLRVVNNVISQAEALPNFTVGPQEAAAHVATVVRGSEALDKFGTMVCLTAAGAALGKGD